MQTMTTYLADKIAEHIFRGTAYTMPSQLWVALFTTDGGDPDNRVEVPTAGGSNYGRLRLYQDGATAPYATAPADHGTIVGRFIENSAALTWTDAGTDWGDITAVGILDAATGGNLLFLADLESAETVLTGKVFRFKPGDLDVIFDITGLTADINP